MSTRRLVGFSSAFAVALAVLSAVVWRESTLAQDAEFDATVFCEAVSPGAMSEAVQAAAMRNAAHPRVATTDTAMRVNFTQGFLWTAECEIVLVDGRVASTDVHVYNQRLH